MLFNINMLIDMIIISTNTKTAVKKLLLIPLPKYCNKTIKAMRGYCTFLYLLVKTGNQIC